MRIFLTCLLHKQLESSMTSPDSEIRWSAQNQWVFSTGKGAYRCCSNNRTFCVYTIKCHAAVRKTRWITKRVSKSLQKGKMKGPLTLASAFLCVLYRRELGTSVGRDKQGSPWRIQHITFNFFPLNLSERLWGRSAAQNQGMDAAGRQREGSEQQQKRMFGSLTFLTACRSSWLIMCFCGRKRTLLTCVETSRSSASPFCHLHAFPLPEEKINNRNLTTILNLYIRFQSLICRRHHTHTVGRHVCRWLSAFYWRVRDFTQVGWVQGLC